MLWNQTMTDKNEPQQDRRRVISSMLALGLPAGVCGFLPTPTYAQARDAVIVKGQTPIVTLQTWVDVYGRPTADVLLNGRGPFKFVVDTGSNTSVLSTRVARLLELAPLPDRVVNGVTGAVVARFGRLGRIETGRSVSLDLPVAIMDAPAFEAMDGILGMDMFANRRIRFNFTRKTVEFEAASRRSQRLPVRVGVRLRQGLLVEAEGRIGNANAVCVLDTGCDTTIINTALLNAVRTSGGRSVHGLEPPQILGVSNQQINGSWVSLPEINLIGLKIRRLTTACADAPVFNLWGLSGRPAMLVGMDILSQVETLVIDYRRREVELRMLANLVEREAATYRG
jgi:Aspartyl protease